jgi:nucleoside recognition membrane protein YjiH
MRFILAGFSVSQLIYMADVGVIILRSSIPLRFRDLVVIFCLRTIILFPIFLIVGHFLL